MRQPKEYEKGYLVCKLNKALYGIKQAGRVWAAKLKTFLESCGFDPCCFTIMPCKGRLIIMVVWVDITTKHNKINVNSVILRITQLEVVLNQLWNK
jgi:hypothetical protein